ncbi:MAG: lactonase family protein [Bryobacterales bacterium]|nr:lactonase family protein [Bryobacterales bacterium]
MPTTLTRRTMLSHVVAATAIAAPTATLLSTLSCTGQSTSASQEWVYVGPYTRGASKGIYRLSFDPQSGALGEPALAAQTANPSFLALHPNGRNLYAVGELPEFQGEKGGSVTAFAVAPETGALRELNAVSSKGGGPCHLMVTSAGNMVVVANYGGGSTVCYRLNVDGELSSAAGFVQHTGSGPNERRQQAPHAHGVALSSVGVEKLAHVADLGIDRILHFVVAADGSLSPWRTQPDVAVAPGAGPRHVITHHTHPLAFVINELDSTITSFTIHPETGVWTTAHTVSTLPEGYNGDTTTAEIALHPNGRVIYGSNRGHDSIATFAVDLNSGKLTLIGHTATEGKTPRNFAVHPSGNWLIAANQNSGNLTVFRVDSDSGMPSFTGQTVNVDAPVCVLFAASAGR